MAAFVSSTIDIPPAREVPRHIAIIMDGNGRWARRRHLPRVAGHRRGVETVRAMVRCCIQAGVEYLTNVASLPDRGYFLFAAVKVRDCHGGPGRALGVVLGEKD